MNEILISDPTLRDGSHAIGHQLSKRQIEEYCKLAERANIPIVEVGHGNGLGASSLQVGESLLTDEEMLVTAKQNLKNTKLGIHVIPGFATIKRDLDVAISYGVDVVRVASHCTEADITKRHIEFARSKGKEVYGVLMMSHMASSNLLVEEAKKMESYGALGVILMDSAGAYLLEDVKERISCLVNKLDIRVGFHAHNNLGLGVANSLIAAQEGATIIDGTSRGFGAGSGNAQLESIIAVLHKSGFKIDIDFYKMLDAAEYIEKEFSKELPFSDSLSIISGKVGVFSGFKKHVLRIANESGVNPRDILVELGQKGIVAGQEDIIIEVVNKIKNRDKI
ncbi:4-hydroxy-2-oxovalerate aldolase [Lysinibacillus fusiformis]|uniref:4-hydroxy-2-oxovalerate aldolase n=1 Tax=Lysinibacillus fusiformis TaxID=28031 RepID=UPI00301A1F2E